MSKFVIRYVWEVPVRVTHWMNVLAIVTLCVTGYLIGNPRTLADDPSAYVMGWIRFIHFVAAYIFTIDLAVRVYWSFAGNRYANWRTFLPYLSSAGRRKMLATFRYYCFIDRKVPHVVGHNTMAAAAYSLLFVLFLVMVVTGFALYSQYTPGTIMYVIFGWLTNIVSTQTLRQVHHLVMWLIIGFVIQHVYSTWLMDIKERGGVVSSMFGGYKSVEEEE